MLIFNAVGLQIRPNANKSDESDRSDESDGSDWSDWSDRSDEFGEVYFFSFLMACSSDSVGSMML